MTYGGAPRDMSRLLTYGYEVKIGEYLSRGWELMQSQIGIFIGFAALQFGIGVVLALIPFGSLATMIVGPPLSAGMFIVAYKQMQGEPVEFSDCFKGFEKFATFLLAGLVSGLLIGVGMVLCLIPGIYLATGYMFTQLVIIDQNLDFWPAMQTSLQLVTKRFFPIFAFSLLLGLINLGGTLLCCVGLLLTLPLTFCALTIAYMDIMNQGA
ncbi:MAG: hypothetical protein NZL92_04445 [Gloeomargarita sp. SKYG116]|nr:hypothetical protein [Gloeomargarita sp. SKYG116]MDW8400926.1 hypothetical protein [Gloeomargarita sp. SKYGB_i_bin116]